MVKFKVRLLVLNDHCFEQSVETTCSAFYSTVDSGNGSVLSSLHTADWNPRLGSRRTRLPERSRVRTRCVHESYRESLEMNHIIRDLIMPLSIVSSDRLTRTVTARQAAELFS